MPGRFANAAIICLVLSFSLSTCHAQDQANDGAPRTNKLLDLQDIDTPGPLSGGPPGRRPSVRLTGEALRQAINRRMRDGAAEAIKDFQARWPAKQFPEERFPLFASPSMQKLLLDDGSGDKLRLLKQRRCLAALVECNARISEYSGGRSPFGLVLDSSMRLASSLLALEPDPATRLTIFRHNLAVTQHLEEYAYRLLENGTGTVQDLSQATYARIDAEIRLKQEKERQEQKDSKGSQHEDRPSDA